MEFQEVKMLSSNYKSSGGLIRIRADIQENKINDIMITGDFFIFPDSRIEEIENALEGKELNLDEIRNTIDEILKDSQSTLETEDFVNAIAGLQQEKLAE
ncbi:MAG TPA: lipoate--protein ligase family protein [Candidatus Altiarchaeales archaeon]|nr:lipoate--protein ligase family protein [Candidatus Altiarchaeales archaeon]